MSSIIDKATKIAFYVTIVLFIVAFFAEALILISNAINSFGFSSALSSVSEYIILGRQLANNFIPAQIFNAAIAIWFLGSATLIADYLIVIIGGKIASVR